MDTPAEESQDLGAHEEAGAASRRSFLRMAGAGVAGTLGAGAIAGTAVGVEHYSDTASARRRGDGATVATLSSATSINVLWRARTDRKVIALTFDDGPSAEHTERLLDELREAKARATFAVVGRNAAQFRDLVRRQHNDGHEVANHTWNHTDLSLHEYDRCKRELSRTDELVADLTGSPTAVIRPPFGRVNGQLLQYAAQTGQKVVLWDMRLLEDQFDAAGNAAYVLDHLRPGTVVLAHDAGLTKRKVGMAAIPGILAGAHKLGYEFVTVSEMFDLDGA
ncbi:polysaccharide deacetylase family protein [Sporichthya sp.]|uniref:polysaccharide deacetylase family protein n=1 Tax=Sporichthya sp. TaxID=65475 RepID=UPI0018541B31|nr:polysaccharide deacetylase family protein [Sporichthya sp.]MBA3743355.1 polysaccharide deacetylase family protein [Sporichthya sp.]